jgi:uncharacterized phage protein gp47/JayE
VAVSLASLLVKETKATILNAGLQIAAALGLPVTSWQAGDPTRALFTFQAERLATLEDLVLGYIASAFLDYASGVWLKVLADQVFGVKVPDATYATTSITLTNTGGGNYTIDVGTLTVKSSTSGKTYRNTTAGVLLGVGATCTLDVVADEAGSASSAGAGEIDALVTGLLGVTCTNPTAAVGIDEQSEDTTRQQCRDKLGSLSPNGPKEAYSYVTRNSDLTTTRNVTRVRVFPVSSTGTVTIYIAGPSGAVSSPDRALVEAAIVKWATPNCITPVVLSAANVVIPVTYQLWIYRSVNKTSAEIQADILTALQAMFAARPIGGDIIAPALTGAIYQSMIASTIRAAFPQAFRVDVSSPAGDTALTNGQVGTLGAITATINLVNDP